MTEYEARARRLEGIILRMRDDLASLKRCEESRKGQRAWLECNRRMLASWPRALSGYNLLRPSDIPMAEARKFSRWARRQRWTNPTLLGLRLECGWLRFRVWTTTLSLWLRRTAPEHSRSPRRNENHDRTTKPH
jgi:hypothetical protein